MLSLCHVERRVAGWRRELRAKARATVRFETPPGKQMQIDFGKARVWIGDEKLRVHLFVARLGFSRRTHVRALLRERQADWIEGMESVLHIGCVPAEALWDNARPLVEHHDAVTREVGFSAKLHAFAGHWASPPPRAYAPYRARTKGKDERGAGYVKKNAVTGPRFESEAAFGAHLAGWCHDVADHRVHDTTGELPAVRFAREAPALRPLGGGAPFGQLRDLFSVCGTAPSTWTPTATRCHRG